MTGKNDNIRRGSIGDIVLWLSLAMMVVIVVIGAVTVSSLYPELNSDVFAGQRSLPAPRIAH